MRILIILVLVLSLSLSVNANDYLGSGLRIESTDSQIMKLAYDITKGEKTAYNKAQAVYEWVYTNIKYDYEKFVRVTDTDKVKELYNYRYGINCGALWAYENKKGVCIDMASLIAAMCRAVDIPCKVVIGNVPDTEYLHAWNQIYVDKWVNVDAVYQQYDVKEFDKSHLKVLEEI